jgi:hypothetical protein
LSKITCHLGKCQPLSPTKCSSRCKPSLKKLRIDPLISLGFSVRKVPVCRPSFFGFIRCRPDFFARFCLVVLLCRFMRAGVPGFPCSLTGWCSLCSSCCCRVCSVLLLSSVSGWSCVFLSSFALVAAFVGVCWRANLLVGVILGAFVERPSHQKPRFCRPGGCFSFSCLLCCKSV